MSDEREFFAYDTASPEARNALDSLPIQAANRIKSSLMWNDFISHGDYNAESWQETALASGGTILFNGGGANRNGRLAITANAAAGSGIQTQHVVAGGGSTSWIPDNNAVSSGGFRLFIQDPVEEGSFFIGSCTAAVEVQDPADGRPQINGGIGVYSPRGTRQIFFWANSSLIGNVGADLEIPGVEWNNDQYAMSFFWRLRSGTDTEVAETAGTYECFYGIPRSLLPARSPFRQRSQRIDEEIWFQVPDPTNLMDGIANHGAQTYTVSVIADGANVHRCYLDYLWHDLERTTHNGDVG